MCIKYIIWSYPIILCGPREHMIVFKKKKKKHMLLYIVHYESAYQ